MGTAPDPDIDVRAPTPIDRLGGWLARHPPRDYRLTRWLILRLLGVIHVFAFVGLILQGPPLLGEHGLTPIGTYLDVLDHNGLGFWDVPSVLWWGASDGALIGWAIAGLVLSIAVALGYANLPMLLALWAIYGSFVRVGQTWFAFGWEIQILETTLLAAVLAHPWDPRPLRAPSPTTTSIVLMRWLAFRIMLGAGLIKLRGDACWADLTCLDWHFETQPIPNPLSPLFHALPGPVLAGGVLFNHVVEVVLPWFAFGPRRLRLVAAFAMAAFQIVLIASGNLAFLNWLTLVPILACLDDDVLLRMCPRRVRDWLVRRLGEPRTRRDGRSLAIGAGAMGLAVVLGLAWWPFVAFGALALVGVTWRWKLVGVQVVAGAFAAVVAMKSLDVVANLASREQAMNRSYDRLALVNTYGAFGSVTNDRHELVIEGTLDEDPATAGWQVYELPCKPTALDRRPCILGPYHLRLDWLIWFAAMTERPSQPWIAHFVWKLLDGDRSIRELLARDPFDGTPPRWIRIRRFRYELAPMGAGAWWTRDREQLWLRPVSLASEDLREVLERRGWPSPSRR